MRPSEASNDLVVAKGDAVRAAPDILIIGDHERCERIELAFQRTDALLQRHSSVDRALDYLRPSTMAALLVDPLPKADLHKALKMLRSVGAGHLPVFVIVDEDFSDEDARRLYDEGATVVFEWPSEVLLMPRMVMEMFELELRTDDEDDSREAGDEALRHAVQARLEVAEGIGEDVEADVIGGTAVLRGHVDSLWKHHRVEGILSHIPGVQGLDLKQLHVRAPERDDDTLEQHVRDVLTSAGNVDTSTVSVSVDQGRVTLAGNMASREELDRLVKIIANIEGVHSIQNLAVIARDATQKSGSEARRIQDAVRQEFGDLRLRVSVFGNIVVLSGRVPLLVTKRKVERFVRDHEPEVRVINKLHIEASPQSDA